MLQLQYSINWGEYLNIVHTKSILEVEVPSTGNW